jgi:hypothetical protein
MLLEPDTTIWKSEVIFTFPKNSGKNVYFTHIVPIDYKEDLTDVVAQDVAKRDLKVERVSGPSFKIDELDHKNVTNYIWF